MGCLAGRLTAYPEAFFRMLTVAALSGRSMKSTFVRVRGTVQGDEK